MSFPTDAGNLVADWPFQVFTNKPVSLTVSLVVSNEEEHNIGPQRDAQNPRTASGYIYTECVNVIPSAACNHTSAIIYSVYIYTGTARLIPTSGTHEEVRATFAATCFCLCESQESKINNKSEKDIQGSSCCAAGKLPFPVGNFQALCGCQQVMHQWHSRPPLPPTRLPTWQQEMPQYVQATPWKRL